MTDDAAAAAGEEPGGAGAVPPNGVPGMPAMNEIVDLCNAFARARDALEEVRDDVREEHRRVLRRRLRGLKARAADVAVAKEALLEAVAAAPELFEKPRTRAFAGIKVGFRAQAPELVIVDEARTVALIGEVMSDREDELVRTKKTVDRPALRKMPDADLAAIGAKLEDRGDKTVVAAAATDLDKLVGALLDGLEEED